MAKFGKIGIMQLKLKKQSNSNIADNVLLITTVTTPEQEAKAISLELFKQNEEPRPKGRGI